MNNHGRDLPMLKLCVAGAAGKMGMAIIREATIKEHQIVGAIEATGNPAIGKTLNELGITDSQTEIVSSERIQEAAENADIYITFTSPVAEVQNIPIIAGLGKKIILGTTGFNDAQNRLVREAVEGKVPAVFSPNYSIGVNVLFKLVKVLDAFPKDYLE
jgi:4-hydroxy-tetrahydrodipicolinate reductase